MKNIVIIAFVLLGFAIQVQAQEDTTSKTKLPYICSEGPLTIANVYTQNSCGDGNGDMSTFGPFGKNEADLEFEVMVFDRWGELLYESKNPEESWDLTLNGKLVKTGTYVYRVRLNCTGDPEQEQQFVGHITVI